MPKSVPAMRSNASRISAIGRGTSSGTCSRSRSQAIARNHAAERQSHAVREEVGRLVDGEAEVRGAELAQLPPPAEAGDRQGRVLPGRDDQVGRGRQVAQEEAGGFVHGGGPDEVVVVGHERGAVGECGDVVDEGGEHGLDVGRGRVEPGAVSSGRRHTA